MKAWQNDRLATLPFGRRVPVSPEQPVPLAELSGVSHA